MEALVQAIEVWPVAVALRKSVWVYPLVNTGHILGIALLLGAIVTLDLRLLGVWRDQIGAHSLGRVLIPVAASGLVLATLMGLLLFIARAADYAWHPLFIAKLGLILAALLNLTMLRRHADWAVVRAGGMVSRRVRFGALTSLCLWIGVLVLGRLVGYR